MTKQYANIGSDIGLVPFRWQAIISTKVDIVCGCIYASPGFSELENMTLCRDHCHVGLFRGYTTYFKP